MMGTAWLLWAALLAGPTSAGPEPQGAEAERLRTAKELFFDGKYTEARAAWQAVLARSQGSQAATAAYWMARSSESLGERERAFKEYGEFLARKPADRTLAEQARTSRVGLAARLVKDGHGEYRQRLFEALDDPSHSVRMFAAIELARLGECQRVAPILRAMLTEEDDEDLVQRARLGLLRCDPGALDDAPRSPRPSRPRSGDPAEMRWLKVRIFEKAHSRAKLSLNIPVALADLVFKSLPEETRQELSKKGYDADNFWERLRRMPPAQILEIEGDEGERVQIWIE
jgi:tetratricopeptide (TPR) repeat protein